MAQLSDGADRDGVREELRRHAATNQYLFHVLVSADVDIHDPMLALWGWFTRFDPLADLHPASREAVGNKLDLLPPICIDATWKQGYRQPVAFDLEKEHMVKERWESYGIPLD